MNHLHHFLFLTDKVDLRPRHLLNLGFNDKKDREILWPLLFSEIKAMPSHYQKDGSVTIVSPWRFKRFLRFLLDYVIV
jgi:hypothetical protein